MVNGDSSDGSKPHDLLLETDWSAVEHCCPNAAPATPILLAQLLDTNEEVQREALRILSGTVTHQNTIYSATAPAACFVAATLGHPRTLTQGTYFHDERHRPLRAALLEWLGDLADDATYTEHGAGLSDDVAAVRAILPQLHRAIQPYLDAQDLTVKEAAVYATAMTLAAPALAQHIPETVPLVRSVLGISAYRGYRYMAQCCLVAWGVEPGPLPSPYMTEPPFERERSDMWSDEPPF